MIESVCAVTAHTAVFTPQTLVLALATLLFCTDDLSVTSAVMAQSPIGRLFCQPNWAEQVFDPWK